MVISKINTNLTCIFIFGDVFKMDPNFMENEEKYRAIEGYVELKK